MIEQGSIVERGTHETLLAQGGAYTRLYDLQLREQEEFEERVMTGTGTPRTSPGGRPKAIQPHHPRPYTEKAEGRQAS